MVLRIGAVLFDLKREKFHVVDIRDERIFAMRLKTHHTSLDVNKNCNDIVNEIIVFCRADIGAKYFFDEADIGNDEILKSQRYKTIRDNDISCKNDHLDIRIALRKSTVMKFCANYLEWNNSANEYPPLVKILFSQKRSIGAVLRRSSQPVSTEQCDIYIATDMDDEDNKAILKDVPAKTVKLSGVFEDVAFRCSQIELVPSDRGICRGDDYCAKITLNTHSTGYSTYSKRQILERIPISNCGYDPLNASFSHLNNGAIENVQDESLDTLETTKENNSPKSGMAIAGEVQLQQNISSVPGKDAKFKKITHQMGEPKHPVAVVSYLDNHGRHDQENRKHPRNLYISAKFKKDFRQLQQSDLRSKVTDILNELSVFLNDRPSEANNYLSSLNSKKFKNANNFWKFYVSDAHRVIYAHGKDIGRHDQSDSVFILRYVFDHDRQGAIAKKSKDMASTSVYEHYSIDSEDDQSDEKLICDYDVEEEIAYVALAGQVEDLLRSNNPKTGVLLNNEQLNCIKPDFPLIIKGSAGSGKTIVSVEIMKMAYEMSTDAIYVTFTEGLRSLAKREFETSSGIRSDKFYSFNEYCIEKLGLTKLDFIDFYDFKKWYLNSFGHLKFDTSEVWAEIRGILKGFMGFDWCEEIKKSQLLPERLYLEGIGFESKFNESERKLIYPVASNYCNWLNSAEKFDDNDLAYHLAKRFASGEMKSESVIVIDEVQDLTERQISMLTDIAKDYHLYLSGDPNQIINPTLFSFERLSNLFYCKQGKAPRTVTLKNNYRNSAPIVNYINNISAHRKRLIGSQKWEDDIPERAMRRDTSGVRVLKVLPTNQNLIDAIELFEKTPNAAVIVATRADKVKLDKLIGRVLQCVFTIFEVKGLEFNHVFCYNIITGNKSMWDEVVSGSGRRSTAHRFFFNVYYVASTRAKEYLCFFEDSADVYFADEGTVRTINIVNFESLEMDSNKDPLEWYDDGSQFERAGLFEKAIRSYNQYAMQSGISSDREVLRCKALSLLEADKTSEGFKAAGNMLIEAGEFDHAERVFTTIGAAHKVFECKMRSGRSNYQSGTIEQKLEGVLKEGLNDEAFVEFLIADYLTPKSQDLISNCQIIQQLLIPEIIEVN